MGALTWRQSPAARYTIDKQQATRRAHASTRLHSESFWQGPCDAVAGRRVATLEQGAAHRAAHHIGYEHRRAGAQSSVRFLLLVLLVLAVEVATLQNVNLYTSV
jgi:hypothetical protein